MVYLKLCKIAIYITFPAFYIFYKKQEKKTLEARGTTSYKGWCHPQFA
jgi:hypothetical protein